MAEFWVWGLVVVLWSTTCTVKVKVPVEVGLPVRIPVPRRRSRPVGGLPETIDHL